MDLPERYANQLRVSGFGIEHMHKLQKAKVLVVGAGGLGCPVLRQLVVLGVKTLVVIDDDKISESNLNRQTLFFPADVGRLKVEIAEERLRQLNPEAHISPVIDRLNSRNVTLHTQGVDLVIDCTDNLATRYTLDKACVGLGLPLVFGGVRMLEGQFGVFNFDGGPSFSNVFPTHGHLEALEDCSTLGTFGFACELIASYQVAEAMKIITGLGKVNSGVITTIDLFENIVLKAKKKLTSQRNLSFLCHNEC